MAYNVAVDVGGPFTDVLLFDEQTGELTPHEANLYDVDAKYGDVVCVEETLEYLEGKYAPRVR